jgi:penicillin-binding protein 1A
MASAFGTFARGGKYQKPWIVKKVTGPDGAEIPLTGRSPEQVVSEQEAYLVTSLLKSVIEEGTATAARALKRPAAGKTGTADDQRDAWFVGYTPKISCSVWVGYDDLRSVGRREYGGKAALPIWIDFMQSAHKSSDKQDFIEPEGIVRVQIDPTSGLLAYEGMEDSIEEIFIEGTEPTETAVPPDLVDPGSFIFDQFEEDAGVSE